MQQLGKERRDEVAREAMEARRRDVGAQDLESFKMQMILKHGNMHRAWVKALDVSGNGRISKVEFFNVARAAGYVADVRKLWEWCDSDGSGFITINELAEEEAELMATFKDAVTRKYGNLYAGWIYLLDETRAVALRPQRSPRPARSLAYLQRARCSLGKSSDSSTCSTSRRQGSCISNRLMMKHLARCSVARQRYCLSKRVKATCRSLERRREMLG